MTREHKYRAWDEEAQEMLYSDKDYERCTFVCESDGILRCFVPEEVPATQDEPSHTRGRELEDIMEYTGLKDKNIKEIYEGDITRIGKCPLPVIVFWDEQVAAWQVTNSHKENGGASLLSQYANDYHNIVEVIGYIHENPDLLKEWEQYGRQSTQVR